MKKQRILVISSANIDFVQQMRRVPYSGETVVETDMSYSYVPGGKGANSAIDILGKMPNLIRVPLVGFLKWTDEKGLLPASLAEDNLYYSTMIVSNLGSIGCGAIHHNITDFGNSSSLLTMGEIEDHEVIKDGKKEVRKICEWGMNFDERIADGYYFAKSAKVLQYLLSNPELLEEPASQKLDLGELR